MTRLEEVLAEEWTLWGGHANWIHVPDGRNPRFGETNAGGDPLGPPLRIDATRAAVAVLGQRALAMMLEEERDHSSSSGHVNCRRCGAEDEPHKPECVWGQIVAAAKALG